jgi:hypothetical protein
MQWACHRTTSVLIPARASEQWQPLVAISERAKIVCAARRIVIHEIL